MYEISDETLKLEVELGDDDPELVENADAWVTLSDQTRWSVTFLTYSELGRIMERWKTSGEYLGGRYFTCPDVVVLWRPGVHEMWDAVRDLVVTGDIALALQRVD